MTEQPHISDRARQVAEDTYFRLGNQDERETLAAVLAAAAPLIAADELRRLAADWWETSSHWPASTMLVSRADELDPAEGGIVTGLPEVRVHGDSLAVHLYGVGGATWAVLQPVNGQLALVYRTAEEIADFAPAVVLTKEALGLLLDRLEVRPTPNTQKEAPR